MDTVILVLSAAAVFAIVYGVVWTVRAVRRVGARRFGRAVAALGGEVMTAVFQLVSPKQSEQKHIDHLRDREFFSLINSIQCADDA